MTISLSFPQGFTLTYRYRPSYRGWEILLYIGQELVDGFRGPDIRFLHYRAHGLGRRYIAVYGAEGPSNKVGRLKYGIPGSKLQKVPAVMDMYKGGGVYVKGELGSILARDLQHFSVQVFDRY